MEFDRYREAAQKRYPRPFKDPSSWQRADPSPTTWNDAQSHDAQQQRELYAQTERYQRPTYPASVQASEAMSMSNSRFNFVQDLHKVSHSKANMSWTVLSPIEPAQFPSALKPKQRMKRLLPDVDDVADNTSEGSLATLSSPSTESQLMYDSKSESSNRKSVHEEEDSPLHISFTNHRGHDLSDGSEGEKEKNLKLRMQIVELQNQLSLAKQMVKNAYFERFLLLSGAGADAET
ncbi:hypothetical protein GUITHDRAFT_150866 [Guillardia theta CCMP2712]|uniref:Uncharacterized protein n=1 Tax=Guillardia theta (strain CCMP2712) TaxID=905079 RepID=L1JUK6_GUITC|nr:hypothetical protein GUITHDRAFT_150866 [Guillardia theta CCMP2712]EKX51999.1 hypothetical protein GUITHDRAFT_150866 [Guillardia theta CCMP2712]|eukprot:XP_005838979.1 hypothetical protein GUITHDRAFT_150866 [Guillardia theta CCMP2712]